MGILHITIQYFLKSPSKSLLATPSIVLSGYNHVGGQNFKGRTLNFKGLTLAGRYRPLKLPLQYVAHI